MALLSIQNITKRYREHTALQNVDLDVPEGTIFGLLGPNGAGKTTLIRIINRIIAPDIGRITFDGSPLKASHTEAIGYLPEERGLYRKMKVGEQAMYLAQLKGLSASVARERLRSWLKKFELIEWWDRKVEELSKGMAQKLQFITTVIHEPRLLILDEPFSGFDPINTELLREEVMNLKEEGTTIIFSTHNMGSVEEVCEDIALIHKARKVLDGNVSEIRRTYSKKAYDIRFKGNMIGFANALWTDFELVDQKTEKDLHYARVRILGDRSANELLNAIMPYAEIHEMKEVVPSMHDIFIDVVNQGNTSHAEDPANH